MELIPWFIGGLVILLIQGISELMRLAGGYRRGGIIIHRTDLVRYDYPPRADNFAKPYLSTMMIAMELVLRDTCEIILEGLMEG